MCGSLGVDSNLIDEGERATNRSPADFVGWSDFPRGLRVLLLDRDEASAEETKLKLEQLDYVVSLFSREDEALEAISSRTDNFHVAIVEVNSSNSQESFRFLETTRGLPTIMVSNGNCMSTMMKCIALGAAEILQKPLSEDKLKNIWQHVVHKAFNAGEGAVCKSLKPIRETVATMLQMQTGASNTEHSDGRTYEESTAREDVEGHDQPSTHDGLLIPSTPQLEQVIRSSDIGDSHDQSSGSNVQHECEVTCKDTADFTFSCSDMKSVDNTCNESIDEDCPRDEEAMVAVNSASDPQDNKESGISKDVKNDSSLRHPLRNGSRDISPKHGSKSSKKKIKVDWTPELHKRFVQAVEQLGIDQAIPSKILSLMKTDGLTRHNVASHLQKYRMHRKHTLTKNEERKWLHGRDSFSRVYAKKPLLSAQPPPMYPTWGHPNFHHPSSFQTWGNMGFNPWHSTQGSWPWKSYSRMYADAWGCPILFPQDHHSIAPQNFSRNHDAKVGPNRNLVGRNLHEPQLGEDVIDGMVKEAISKPWLPLPIGLNPPSTDSVLAELQRQGIHRFPPTRCRRPRDNK